MVCDVPTLSDPFRGTPTTRRVDHSPQICVHPGPTRTFSSGHTVAPNLPSSQDDHDYCSSPVRSHTWVRSTEEGERHWRPRYTP